MIIFDHFLHRFQYYITKNYIFQEKGLRNHRSKPFFSLLGVIYSLFFPWFKLILFLRLWLNESFCAIELQEYD